MYTVNSLLTGTSLTTLRLIPGVYPLFYSNEAFGKTEHISRTDIGHFSPTEVLFNCSLIY